MRATDSMLNSHMREYVSAVMSKTLQAHGFTSRNDTLAHWYRIKGGDLVQAIFFSTDGYLPAFAQIAYSVHPLFVMPFFPRNTRRSGVRRSIHAVRPYKVLGKPNVTTAPYSPEAMIMCPRDDHHGLDIVEEVIEILNSISTIEQCYQNRLLDLDNWSRQSNTPIQELWVRMLSPEMMDEIVFLGDFKMYPYCAEKIQASLDRFEMWQSKRKLADVERYEFSELTRLKSAIIDGQRSAHLEYLAECRRTYSAQLKKKVKGIRYIL